jgi:hypothetical protein
MESIATAVGAGILLGGFVSGCAGLARLLPKREFEAWVLKAGYLGGVGGAAILLADIIFRYAL